MRKTFLILTSFSFGLAALALMPQAKADTLTLNSGTYVSSGYYVGPLNATLDGQAVTILCKDFDHEVYFGETWDVKVINFSDLSQVRFNTTPGFARKYQEVAWLDYELINHLDQVGDIQKAIWREFSNDPTLVNSVSTGWLNMAHNQDLSTFDFSHYEVLTPTDPNQFQEMTVVLAVPEMSTFAYLFLLGLPLAFVLRRQRIANLVS